MCTSVKGSLYQTVAQIGDGGFSNVYKICHDTHEFAAKVIDEEEWLSLDEADEPETTVSSLALRELAFMKLLTGLKAPQIVPLLDFAFGLDDVFAVVLVLPLYSGDVAAAIKHKMLAAPQRIGVACDLLEGLAFLHGCKPAIVHRDLKPENVLLDATNRAFLADFGLASFGSEVPIVPDPAPTPPKQPAKRRKRSRSRSPFHSGCVGTDTYVAPEALDGGLAHASLDLWAAGVTLWELYDNERLDADTDTTAIRRLRRWREDLRGKVPRLLRGLLADEPLQRTPAATVLVELRRLCKLPRGKPVKAPQLQTPVVQPSEAIAEACRQLGAKVPFTAQAAERYREAAPDVDARLLVAVAYKLFEHRPKTDCEIMQLFSFDPAIAVDVFEEQQEALVKRLDGNLLTVIAPPTHPTQ